MHASDNAVIVDGISVIVGSRTSNESDAQPVLLSDIAFEAILIAASTSDANAYDDFTPGQWQRARRQAVLVRLLAAQARLQHETISGVDKRAVRDEISKLIGGDVALYRILARHGMDPQLIDIFVENTALALTQIRYFEEQNEPTGLRGNERRGRQMSRLRMVRAFHALWAKQNDAQMQRWIEELLSSGHVRMIR